MKAFSIAFCLASAILIGGCADPIERPMAQEAGEKFQRGITGNLDILAESQPDAAHAEHVLDALLDARSRLSKTQTMMMVKMRAGL